MSKTAELAYDIEQLFIEGFSPKTIAAMLECPIEIVYNWIDDNGCEDVAETLQELEVYSPYYGA